MKLRAILTAHFFMALMLLLGSASCCAAAATAAPCTIQDLANDKPQLRIVVYGARRVAGNITYTLYGGDASRFLKPHGSIALTRVTLVGLSTEACFKVETPGTYAVAVYHDENDNHHFDKNFLGLPAEGYGFSNDAPALLGPPSFDAARVIVRPGDNRITIHLRY